MPAGRGGGRGRQPAGVKSVQRWPRKPQAAAGWPLCAGRTGARTPAGRGRTRARARPRWGAEGAVAGGGREAGTSAGWRRHVAVSPGARRTGEVWPSPDRRLLYRGREGGEGAGTAACARAAVKAGRRGGGVGSTACTRVTPPSPKQIVCALFLSARGYRTGLEALGAAKGVPIYRIASHRCTVPEVPRSWVGGSCQRDQRRLLPAVEPLLAVLPPFSRLSHHLALNCRVLPLS